MTFGVIGLGSMGSRRVRDLLGRGDEVIGCDLREDRRTRAHDGFGIPTTGDAETLIRSVEAVVICTPPDRHHEFYRACFDAGRPFFSEANILTPPLSWLERRQEETGVRGFPSATWRFHPVLRALRDALAGETSPLCTLHHHYGGYLPAWHPWEQYDEFYGGARRATCAAREMVPFELEWLVWMAGPVRAVCARRSRRLDWRTDIDDTYELLLEFGGGATGSLIVELHQIAPVRRSRLSGAAFNFDLDLAAPRLVRRTLTGEASIWREGAAVDFEGVYRDEIDAFAGALQGEIVYPRTWADDRHLSDVLFAAEESDRCRTWVTVADIADEYDGWMEAENV